MQRVAVDVRRSAYFCVRLLTVLLIDLMILPPALLHEAGARRSRMIRASGSGVAEAQSCNGTSSSPSNFNGTSIAAGRTIWFNAVFDSSGVPTNAVTTIQVLNQSIEFSAAGTSYSLSVPDSAVTFDPGVTSASTSFDTGLNRWITTVPAAFSQNVFLSGFAYSVPAAGLPSGINPVTWMGDFVADRSGVTLSWKWGAAVYTQFTTDNNAIGVKPVDGNTQNPYPNSNHAGTPENFKSYVAGGARGGGGSNWTGSYSGTKSVTACSGALPTATPSPTPTATPDVSLLCPSRFLLIDSETIASGATSIEDISFNPPHCGNGSPSVCVNADIAAIGQPEPVNESETVVIRV